MPIMRIAAIDPALVNFGMAKMTLDLTTLELKVLELKLVETDKQTTKQVRQNSDDYRRAKIITKEFQAWIADCSVVFAEIPSGAQDSRSGLSFGISIGILANSTKPLIQVQPSETKMATVGTKTASKPEMVEWAVEKYPGAPWLYRKLRGKMELVKKNEHLADAIAVAYAGITTDQFLQVLAMWRANTAA